MHVAEPPWLTDYEKPRGVIPGDPGSDVYITAVCSENPEKYFHWKTLTDDNFGGLAERNARFTTPV
jgi:hypothetical protein